MKEKNNDVVGGNRGEQIFWAMVGSGIFVFLLMVGMAIMKMSGIHL